MKAHRLLIILGFLLSACGGGENKDTEAPDSPIISAIPQSFVNENAIDISGFAEAGATIELFDSDGTTSLGTAQADAEGKWTLSISGLSEGEHQLAAIATDAAGNVSAISGTFTISVDIPNLSDVTPPGIPAISQPLNGALLNSTKIAVSGIAEANSTIELFSENDKSIGSTSADDKGAWQIETVALSQGLHKINAVASDAAGNKSVASAEVSIQIDSLPPELSQTSPSSAATDVAPHVVVTVDFGESLLDQSTDSMSLTLTRNTDGASVTGTVSLSNDDQTLSFTPSSRLKWGVEYALTVADSLTDRAGNAFAGSSWTFTTQSPPAVNAHYENATNWNDYVRASDTNIACDGSETGGYSVCVHGGEKREVVVPTYDSCDGLTAEDALKVFEWQCDDSTNPVRMISSGLKDSNPSTGSVDATVPAKLISLDATFIKDGVAPGDIVVNTTQFKVTSVVSVGDENWLELADDIFVSGDTYSIATDKRLSDLIDFDMTVWKLNSVTVMENGGEVFTTASSQWWSNPLVVDNDGGILTDASTIYLVTNEANADYFIEANKSGFVVQPGKIHVSNSGGSSVFVEQSDFVWIEGFFDATGQDEGVAIELSEFAVFKGVVSNNADYNLSVFYSENNLLSNIVANNVTSAGMTTGLYLTGINHSTLQNVFAAGNPDGVTITNSSNNEFTNINASQNARYGIWLQQDTMQNTFVNIEANSNGNDGLFLANASNNSFSDIQAKNNPYGVSLSTSNDNSFSNVTISSSLDEGMRIYGGSTGNQVSNITVTDGVWGISLNDTQQNTIDGAHLENNGLGLMVATSNNNTLLNIVALSNDTTNIQFDGSTNNTLQDVNIVGSLGTGLSINNSDDNSFINIVSNENDFAGIFVSNSDLNQFANVTANKNGDYGIYLENSTSNELRGVLTRENTQTGISLEVASSNFLSDVETVYNSSGIFMVNATGNSFYNISAVSNEAGMYLVAETLDNIFSGFIVANNSEGIVVGGISSGNLFTNITAVNNESQGIELGPSSIDNTLSGITAANNGGIGVYLSNTSNNSLNNVVAINNGLHGVGLATASNNSLQNIAAAHNAQRGVSIGNSSENYFTGYLKVGNNGFDCVASGGTNRGLETDCSNNGSSDATLVQGVSLVNSFVGPIFIDDSVNVSDSDGGAEYPVSGLFEDWTNFENSYRSWGYDSAFPGADSRSWWFSGAGRIWDWSLDINDAVLRDVLAIPTGSDTITHTWSDLSTTTYLRNAQEYIGDLVGNDNGLCETGEVCLYTPNIASYQGHVDSPVDNCATQHASGLCLTGEIGTGQDIITLIEFDANGY